MNHSVSLCPYFSEAQLILHGLRYIEDTLHTCSLQPDQVHACQMLVSLLYNYVFLKIFSEKYNHGINKLDKLFLSSIQTWIDYDSSVCIVGTIPYRK